MRRAFLATALRWGTGFAACGAAGAAWARAFSVAQLQLLLRTMPHAEVRFTELRESRWLATPVESSGTLRSSAGMLERQVELPRRETWRILDDRMQLGTPGSDQVLEIALENAPAVAALALTLRSVMAGNLEPLNADFQLLLSGDEHDWTLQLTPQRPDVARQLRQISVMGAGRRLSAIVVVESQGDRTTTRLRYPQ
jgi:hypothetical protein